MTTTIDITSFGFTPTESRVYNALLDLGPSTGYGLARSLGIARANIYHAIESLKLDGAITVLSDRPLAIRAVRPDALADLLSARERAKLDRLDEQVRRRGDVDGPGSLVPIASKPSLVDLANRIIVREDGDVQALAASPFYASTAAAWRKRASDGLKGHRWWYGGAPVPGATEVALALTVARLGHSATILAGTKSALWASDNELMTGWLTHDELTVHVLRCAIANVVAT